MFSRRVTRAIATGAAAIAVTIGGYAAYNSNASSTSGAANATPAAHTAPGPGPRTHPAPGAANGPIPTAVYGQVPQAWHPGSGKPITGATPDKAKAAALAMFPGGTVNRVLQLSDGSYAVHIIGTGGPHHIFVSMDFKVTGAA
jgi:hypothetical protein